MSDYSQNHDRETEDFLGGKSSHSGNNREASPIYSEEASSGMENQRYRKSRDISMDTNGAENKETKRSNERPKARSLERQRRLAADTERHIKENNNHSLREGRVSRKADRNKTVNRRGSRRTGRKNSDINMKALLLIIVLAAVILLLILGIITGIRKSKAKKIEESQSVEASIEASVAESESESEAEALSAAAGDLEKAELMAAQYDYDGAIELIRSMPNYSENEELKTRIAEYEEIKSTLVEQDIYKITHVFFHILCVDPENSFNESKWGTQAGGYNSLMTTISEFEKMMQEMYDKGYVLVSIRDIAHEEVQEGGTTKMVKGSIMLPPGKKAFVMSEDDVCYYEYMKGAGYADKMVIGDDGRPTTHYTDKDGNESVGDYDIVPILDKFIDEHPDFSYRGHKACLVFTGYNGILGYRTDESYDPDSEYYDPKLEQGHDVEAERREAVEVLKALHEDGYDLGSHSWGHRDLGQIEMERFKKDCDRWNRNVAPLIKEATGSQPDIIIFPKGADIGDWHPYAADNERFKYMYNLGFRYFCNVDNNQYWVQLGDTYLRQGRRALDGYNMWLQMSGQNDRLSDLFDNVSEIFDSARPTPVPSY